MAGSSHPVVIRRMISYAYLVSFCPPQYIDLLKGASEPMRTRLAGDLGCRVKDLAALAAPEVAMRIVSFQQATREPELEIVEALAKHLAAADSGPQEAVAFQRVMQEVAAHPGRAKLSKRLHRLKGCALCSAPCRYGFITLISAPDFRILQAKLDEENRKPAQKRNAVNVLWSFTREHIWKLLGTRDGIISAEHLNGLAYCLLLLGIAKSRFAVPETQLRRYQHRAQLAAQRLANVPIRLSAADGHE